MTYGSTTRMINNINYTEVRCTGTTYNAYMYRTTVCGMEYSTSNSYFRTVACVLIALYLARYIYNFKGWASENVVVLRCTSVPHNYSLFFDI